ncbi:MAG: hypothetical protein MJ086_04060 [Lachnospiraceae bacterium]|nr:hypothetical protein [Lachnospiraceae bacterium]
MKLKHWIKIIIFAGLSIVLIVLASSFLCVANEKDTVGVYGFFKEPKDSIDVVLIGPSTMYTSFYSPLAYEKYGFTSYSLATSSMTSAAYKSAVQIAEKEQHPDLYVVEIWGFCYEDQLEEVSLRKWIDALPSSDIRNQTIEELVPEEEQSSFKYPLIKYHSRWDDLGGCFKVFLDKKNIDKKGFSVTKSFATTPIIYPYAPQESPYRIKESGFTYLDIFLNYCKEAGIENILFVRSPELIQYTPVDSYYEMIDKIHAAGYDFLNMEAVEDEMGLDVNHDYYNSTHLNIFGAEKYTDYLSKYVMDNYNLNTNYAPEVKKEWDYCASFNDHVIEKLKTLTENNSGGYLYTQKDLIN